MQNNRVKSIFEYRSYKQYLCYIVGNRNQRTGLRSRFARVLKCQPTYISQILYGNSDLSLEQSYILSEYLGHTESEKQYFLLLVQKARAGTESLRNFFNDQIQDKLNNRLNLVQRLGNNDVISEEHQSIYYSSWQYAAVHIALTIPSLRSINSLSEAFRISKKRIGSILEFLCLTGLATEKNSVFSITKKRVRLGNSSPNIIRHHSNWRQQAIESLEREDLYDLHYSGVISLSEKDVRVLKDRLLSIIEELLKVVESSEEEKLYGLNCDLFNLFRP